MSLKSQSLEFIRQHPLWSIVIGLTLVISAGVFLVRANESADDLRERALRNMGSGHYEQARADIERALEIDPSDEETIVIAANVSLEFSDVERARELYARIETPRLLDVHVLFANTCLRHNYHQMAEGILNAVLERRPDHWQALASLLRVYRTSYRDWEFRTRLLSAVDYPRQQVDLRSLLGIPLSQDAFQEEGWLVEVQDVHHADPVARLAACINHIRFGDLSDARDALIAYTNEFPDMTEGQARLGGLLARQNDFERLREWFAVLPASALEHPDVCFAIGVMFENLSQPEDARAFYQRALSLDYRHRDALGRYIDLLDEAESETARQLTELADLQDEAQRLLVNPEPGENRAGVSIEWGKTILDRTERLGWLYEAQAICELFGGTDEAGEITSRRESIETRLSDEGERDWPAIDVILRSLDSPASVEDIWRREKAD